MFSFCYFKYYPIHSAFCGKSSIQCFHPLPTKRHIFFICVRYTTKHSIILIKIVCTILKVENKMYCIANFTYTFIFFFFLFLPLLIPDIFWVIILYLRQWRSRRLRASSTCVLSKGAANTPTSGLATVSG